MTLTFDAVVRLALSVFPDAEISIDANGDWVVHTMIAAVKPPRK